MAKLYNLIFNPVLHPATLSITPKTYFYLSSLQAN